MSKVYIISTHAFDADNNGLVFDCKPEHRKLMDEDRWESCFGAFNNLMAGCHCSYEYNYYYELPSAGDCRVYAVHELPVGNECLCQEWLDALHSYFVKNEDTSVVFILHDLDLLPSGKLHFYSPEYSSELEGKSIRVFGFHHGIDDIIGRRICSHFDTSESFSVVMDVVLKKVHLRDIVQRCIEERKYPENNFAPLFSEYDYDIHKWRTDFPNPYSRSYIKYLQNIKSSLLK